MTKVAPSYCPQYIICFCNSVIASQIRWSVWGLCCGCSGSEGVVEDVVLLGAPVDGSEKAWEKMTRVVAGKIVNGYCRWTIQQCCWFLLLSSIFLLYAYIHLSEATGFWDSCTEVQLLNSLLLGYSQSPSRIAASSMLICHPWWVRPIFKLDLLKCPKLIICYVNAVWLKNFFFLTFVTCMFSDIF